MTTTDMTAEGVVWDLTPLLPEPGEAGVKALLDQADALAAELAEARGQVGEFDADRLAAFMTKLAELHDLVGRADNYAGLDFSTDTTDPARGALDATRRGARDGDRDDAAVLRARVGRGSRRRTAEALLADDRLAFARHHLRSARRYRPHLLSEPEEVVLTEKSVTGRNAWQRLFEEQVSAITRRARRRDGAARSRASRGCTRPTARCGRPRPKRSPPASRRTCARARSCMNTLLADKATDDRMRHFDSWIASRNLANEASDESVQALVDAVQGRYSIPQRWYALKAQLLGLDTIADYDRMASVADTESEIGWDEATEIVLDAYASFSPELADTARRFFDGWIDAPARPGQAARRVLRVHGAVAPPVRAAELDLAPPRRAHARARARPRRARVPRASAGRLPPDDAAHARGDRVGVRRDRDVRPAARADRRPAGAARAARVEPRGPDRDGVPPDRDEPLRGRDPQRPARRGRAVGRADRRAVGADADRHARPAVEVTEGYRTWWSYIPHFIGTPGYVYAYAYGQLLALSVYARYEETGADFVPQYLDLLRAGGSMPPEELGQHRRRRPRRSRVLGPRPRHRRAPPRRDRTSRARRRPHLTRSDCVTYRVIQWSHRQRRPARRAPHRAPSRARARRAVGAQRRQGGQGRGGAGRHRAPRRHGDQRRRRAARARRRLRLLHRDRRPAAGRSDRRHGAHRGVGQEHRVELGRAARVPRARRARDAPPARGGVRERGRVVLHVRHRPRLGERPAAARAHRHVRVRDDAARHGDRQLRDVRAADGAVRHDGLRPAARRDAVAADSRACCRSRGAAP